MSKLTLAFLTSLSISGGFVYSHHSALAAIFMIFGIGGFLVKLFQFIGDDITYLD